MSAQLKKKLVANSNSTDFLWDKFLNNGCSAKPSTGLETKENLHLGDIVCVCRMHMRRPRKWAPLHFLSVSHIFSLVF